MQFFYLISGILLLILVPLLIYSSKRLMEGSRNSTYLAAAFCFVIGAVALYIAFFQS